MSYLPELFESKDFATTIKVLDSMAGEAQGPALASLLCNRALCYQKMDLHRKALKNYDEAVKALPTFMRAHLGRGVALQGLGRQQEAQAAWRKAIEGFSPADDLQLVEAAYAYIKDPAACLRKSVAPLAAEQTAGNQPLQQQPVQQVANGAVTTRPAVLQPTPAAAARSRQTMPDASTAVGLAVSHINSGRVDEALQLLADVIRNSQAPNMGALVARGTARALKRDLSGAIEDFTSSIKIYPSYADAWKRRGQAKSANGDKDGALTDFQRALELVTDSQGRAEILAERAMIYQKERDLQRAVKELEASVRLDSKSVSAWNHLGLCRTGLGDIEAGCEAYRRAIALDEKHLEAWFNMAQAHKEAGNVPEAEKAFQAAFKLAKAGPRSSHMRRVYAHMKQGKGEHMPAIEVLTQALESAEGASRVECFFLRGACYHALGYHKSAMEDYSKAFLISNDDLSEETRQQQVVLGQTLINLKGGLMADLTNASGAFVVAEGKVLAFFQRELALHANHHLDDAVASFSLDREIHPIFKELWCKKVPPNQAQVPACQLQHLTPPAGDSDESSPLPDLALTAKLTEVADALGVLLQNRHQGFLHNRRQQRMGGLAAIELAQKVRQLLVARRGGKTFWVSEGATGDPETHAFGWRDAMDIVVKWRQLSEPNDQVIWVDLLTKSEFEAGFGSHTPMYSGQTKCVRYYMNFQRALRLLKEILLKDGRAFNASSNPIPLGSETKQEAIRRAETADDLWAAVGEDSWAVVPIQSLLHPGASLEGTRLTVVKLPSQPDAYEMSIRTPVTPPRWHQFDEELSALWEQLLGALESGNKPRTAVAILTFVYYWYNFMPLARGTAVSGYITLLSLFMAAGMPVTEPIPKDYQVDWEAILQRSPAEFITSLSKWMLPTQSLAAGRAEVVSSDFTAEAPNQAVQQLTQQLISSGVLASRSGAAEPSMSDLGCDEATTRRARARRALEEIDLADLPSVADLVPTLRNRLEILNGPELPRL